MPAMLAFLTTLECSLVYIVGKASFVQGILLKFIQSKLIDQFQFLSEVKGTYTL